MINGLMPNVGGGPGDPPAEDFIELKDLRKLFGATGKPLSEKGNKSGKYSRRNIQHIVYAAKELGIDPLTALAVSMQESKIGNVDENFGHVLRGTLTGDKNFEALKAKYPDVDDMALAMNYVLKQKLTTADKLKFQDEALRLQTYNGLGKISPKTEADYHKSMGVNPNIMYGLDLTQTGPIDMRQNPLYGKTVIDLRDNVLRQNPQLLDYVNATIEGKVPLMKGMPQPKAVDKPWDGGPVEEVEGQQFVRNDDDDLIPLEQWNKTRGRRKNTWNTTAMQTGMAAGLVPQ